MKDLKLAVILGALVGWSISAQAGLIQSVPVSAGDTAALIEAIELANAATAGVTTQLQLSGTYTFANNLALPSISGSVVLSGFAQGHTQLVGTSKCGENDQLIHVAETGQLAVEYVDFKDFCLGGEPINEQHPLLENFGTLELRSVYFENVEGHKVDSPLSGSAHHPMIVNEGRLEMDGVIMLNVGVYVFVPSSQTHRFSEDSVLTNFGDATLKNLLVLHDLADGETGSISNYGDLQVINVTFSGPGGNESLVPIVTRESGHTQVVNSIFGRSYSGEWCQDAESLGHNLILASNCDFDAEADVVGLPTGLTEIQRVAVPWHGVEATHGIKSPTSTSLAVGTADPARCPPTDALQRQRLDEEDADGLATCDRGAVEFSGSTLERGGATGWFYDPDKNGHYVFVLDNVYNVLVGWNTFDRMGNQAWIYATGELVDGKKFEADAYVNLDGQLTPDGPININRAVPWGRISLDFDSCTKARFTFQSDFAEFGSGEFTVTRLANSRQLVCQD